MKWNRTTIIAILSSLGMLALLFSQVRWMKQSSQLLSEQFDQKVTKALSMAVEKLRDPSGVSTCATGNDGCYVLSSEKERELKWRLTKAMKCYDLPPTFEFQIVQAGDTPIDEDSPYCCSLRYADERLEKQMVQISFPDKPKYIVGKMWFMLMSSIFILLLLTGVFVFTNLTLRKQKRISERNTDFFNNMAHEFKTPLTNILLATKMLKKKQKDNPFLEVVHEEGERLNWQVERILYLAKMEYGEYKINKEFFLLEPLIGKLLSGMYARLQSENAEINIEIPDGLQVYADPFHIENSIRNLLDNALKYCEQKPEIQITAKETTEGILLQVKDNGIGISKANQNFIFNKFQRIGSGNLHQQKGFGLGLTYVQKVMELHSGFIRIASELNNGSRFDLVLPVKS